MNRQNLNLVAVLAALAGGALLSGCVHHHETVYEDAPRTHVTFENDKAARLFYEALALGKSPGRQLSKTEVHVPVVFGHERRVVEGPNAGFNRAVAQCDSNRDGTITEKEAGIFAASKNGTK